MIYFNELISSIDNSNYIDNLLNIYSSCLLSFYNKFHSRIWKIKYHAFMKKRIRFCMRVVSTPTLDCLSNFWDLKMQFYQMLSTMHLS